MRILFHAPGPPVFRVRPAIAHTTGVPPQRAVTIESLRPSHALTGNRGNAVHAEAPAKLVVKDDVNSCFGGLHQLLRAYGPSFGAVMRDNFDVVVLSLANFIRPKRPHGPMVEAIKALPDEVDLVVLGAGIQDDYSDSELDPSTLDFARVLNDRSRLLGVRGERTAAWFRSRRMHRAIPLGCPSLFVYPSSITTLRAPDVGRESRLLTAGHLSPQKLAHDQSRGRLLLRGWSGRNGSVADYVFQDEIFSFSTLLRSRTVFDEALQELRADIVNQYLHEETGMRVPFGRYFYFTEVAAWRQVCRSYDAYIGDRFHGGVVALQAGVPTLLLRNDERVAEMVSLFEAPSIDLARFAEIGPDRAIKEALNESAVRRFVETYSLRLSIFREAMNSAGLQLADTV